MLITAPSNVRYLCGFTGSNGWLFVSQRGVTLFTDPRYTVQASQQTPFPVRVAAGPLLLPLASVLKRRKIRRLAVERNRIGFETWDSISKAVTPGCETVPVDGAVETLRMKKSPLEIDLIRQSVQTNSRAFQAALAEFKPGLRESELAAEIDYQSRRLGAEMPAFETIVASGKRSALPHARPTSARIETGTALLIDMGAFEQGYASDMTRTVHVGKAPKRFKANYRAVLEAQLAAIDATRPGVPFELVDRAARQVLTRAGMGEAFVHSTGHGLGLEIHEPPRIGKRAKGRLETGFVVTIEPGVYFEEYGGVRIEDTVVVTDSGCEILTLTSKELIEI